MIIDNQKLNISAKLNKFLFLFAFIFVFFVVFLPNFLNAQDITYTLIEPLPCVGDSQKCDNGLVREITFKDFIGYLFQFFIAAAVFLSVIMIMWSGFKYITTESISGKGDAKDGIWNAVLGLVVALSSYLILQTIDPSLVSINANLERIEVNRSEQLAFQNLLFKNIVSTNSINYKTSVEEQTKTNTEIKDIEKQIQEIISAGGGENNLSEEDFYRVTELRTTLKDKKADLLIFNHATFSAEFLNKNLPELAKINNYEEMLIKANELNSKSVDSINKSYRTQRESTEISQNPDKISALYNSTEYYASSLEAEIGILLTNRKYLDTTKDPSITAELLKKYSDVSLRSFDYFGPGSIVTYTGAFFDKDIAPGSSLANSIKDYYKRSDQKEKESLQRVIDNSITKQNIYRNEFNSKVDDTKIKKAFSEETDKRIEYLNQLKNSIQ